MTDIDEVKSKLSVIDIVGAKVQLKKAGRNFKALCPFHSEKTPSFMVSTERQTWHCFGCGKGGSVIDFVMEMDHVDFLEALEMLAEKAGVKLEHRTGDTPEAKLKQKIYEVNHLASEFYHYVLTKHRFGEKARTYLKHRDISDKSIKTFMLGYSPNSWEGLYKYLLKKGYDDQLMEKAGLVLRGSGRSPYYDRFRGRVMFTLKDQRGNVVGFAGRFLDPDAKEAKYINTSETPVYSKSNVLYGLDVTRDAIAKSGEAIIMEGELDVISSFQEGVGNAVAIKGSALTEGHVNLLRRFCERILFALDSDVAGDAASRRGIEIADRAGLDMKVVLLPQGKDPDDIARQSPAILKKAIKDAIPIYDYFLSSAVSRYDITTAFGKRKVTDEVLPVLAKIENEIIASHYTKLLSKTLDVPEDTINDAIRKEKKNLKKGMNKQDNWSPAAKPRLRIETIELYVLALLLQGKTAELFDELQEAVQLTDITSVSIRRILMELQRYLQANRIFLIKDFADTIPKELLTTFDEAYLWDISEFSQDEDRFAKSWIQAIRELRKELLRRKIHDMTVRIKESADNEQQSAQLQNELKDLTVMLTALEKTS